MILPDVNLLVYAHNADSRQHAAAINWWRNLVSGRDPVAICCASLVGFVRITTHPGIQSNPLSIDEAFEITDSWFEAPNVQWLHPGSRHYSLFQSLLKHVGVGGNLVSDAHLAALALEHNCELHSNDTDFGRFKGLNWVNPLVS